MMRSAGLPSYLLVIVTIADLPTTQAVNIHQDPLNAPIVPKERRRAKRSALRMRANVTLPGDLTLEAHTIDISLSGLSCRAPYALDAGQSCTV